MLELRDEYEEEGSPRLVIIARPGVGTVEMEFLAVFADENIEDRIAFMSDQAETPDVSEVSFRLASSLRILSAPPEVSRHRDSRGAGRGFTRFIVRAAPFSTHVNHHKRFNRRIKERG